MPAYWMFVLCSIVPNQAEFKSNDIEILVDVSSSVYTYSLTNHSADPIVGLQIPEHACYDFRVPKGWKQGASRNVFECSAEDPLAEIAEGQKTQFSFRVSSTGAVLGRVAGRIVFRSGRVETIDGLWAPVRQSRRYVILVVATLIVIVSVHTLVLSARDNRQSQRRAS